MGRAGAVVVLALVVVAGSSACGGTDGPGATTADGRLRLVAGFYPLAEAARRVGGDRVEVTNLTPAGSEPHDLELSSREVDRIEDAAVVLYLGGGFQPAVAAAAARTTGAAVDLLAPELGLLAPRNEGGHRGEGHQGEGHGEEGTDPHVWLDPTLQRRMAEQVRAALAAADPEHAAAYQANAAAYGAELEALDAEFRQGLADCERRVIVTSHDAFGYLARRYGLVQEAIAGLSPESEPEPRRLAELTGRVRDEGITTIFYETLVAPDVAETLAREAGVATAVLDPLEGLSEDRQAAGATYASVMRANLAAIRTALGCR